jgi:hypothetical protein
MFAASSAIVTKGASSSKQYAKLASFPLKTPESALNPLLTFIRFRLRSVGFSHTTVRNHKAKRSGVRVSLFLIVALPFLGALLPGLMNSAGRAATAGVTFMVSLLAFIGLLTNLPAVWAGELVTARLDWIPLLGLNVTLMLDGLGFFFALLILGIGLLIITYGRSYLSRDDNMGEFFHLSFTVPGRDGRDCLVR